MKLFQVLYAFLELPSLLEVRGDGSNCSNGLVSSANCIVFVYSRF